MHIRPVGDKYHPLPFSSRKLKIFQAVGLLHPVTLAPFVPIFLQECLLHRHIDKKLFENIISCYFLVPLYAFLIFIDPNDHSPLHIVAKDCRNVLMTLFHPQIIFFRLWSLFCLQSDSDVPSRLPFFVTEWLRLPGPTNQTRR